MIVKLKGDIYKYIRILVLLITTLQLTSCVLNSGCIYATDINSKVTTISIEAQRKCWKDTGIYVYSGSSTPLEITSYDVSLCVNKDANGTIIPYVLDLPTSDISSYGMTQYASLDLKKGDKIYFSIKPYIDDYFTEEMCNNNRPDLAYIENVDLCLHGGEVTNDIGGTVTSYHQAPLANTRFIYHVSAHPEDANSNCFRIGHVPGYLMQASFPYYSDAPVDSIIEGFLAEVDEDTLCNIVSKIPTCPLDECSGDLQSALVASGNKISCEDIKKACQVTNGSWNSMCGIMCQSNNDTNCYVTQWSYIENLPDPNNLTGTPEQSRSLLPFVATSVENVTYYVTGVDANSLEQWSGLPLFEEIEIKNDIDNFMYGLFPVYSDWKSHYRILVHRDCDSMALDRLYYRVMDDDNTYDKCDNSLEAALVMDSNGIPIDSHQVDFNSTTIDGTKSVNITANINGFLEFVVLDDNYDDNFGHFLIEHRQPREFPTWLSEAILGTEKEIIRVLYGSGINYDGMMEISRPDGVVGSIYRAMTDWKMFEIFQLILTLGIAVYGIIFMMGGIQQTKYQAVSLVAKTIIVIILFRPESWEFMYNNFFQVFINGPKYLIGAFGVDGADDFSFVDKVFGRFFFYETWALVFAMMFSGPLFIGYLTILVFIFCMKELAIAIFKLCMLYYMAIIVISLLISLAPFFMIFIFFNKTKVMFDNWLKILIQTSMHPVIAFTGVTLIVEIIDVFLFSIWSFDVCAGCAYKIDLVAGGLNLGEFCLIAGFIPLSFNPEATYSELAQNTFNGMGFWGIPTEVCTFVCFTILANTINKILDYSGVLVSAIFQSYGAVLTSAMQGITNKVNTTLRRDSGSQARDGNEQFRDKVDEKPDKSDDGKSGDKSGGGKSGKKGRK
ncbi:MAG: trbL/VirB6 plasmid conjugal transfer family protein [Candidatus Xenolissoclinum pacificiensis L6]|uniref:TrbL/VirB6 plasmid conjugal transfer family protein n=1 Tax=Candidatus Xenolissoclinum pacificiensis L6 TaxID=1401685 RepID=W2V2W3_9RICK|nr:MAG: trbL/VirB6 plasmid conjugal transfer family protein [Candidatus Xenolissoclinum pacificiensis L6]